MKKGKKMQWVKSLLCMAIFVFLLYAAGSTADAETAATVIARSANIRQEANANSTVVASVVKDNTVSIIGKITGADGKVWYQVFIDADNKGYIRSDLVQVDANADIPLLEGSASDTTTSNTDTAGQSATVDPTGAIEVVPVTGTISGANTVNVRAKASKNAGWVASVQKNTAVTVTGYMDASDGRWYLLSFDQSGQQVQGFIRSDYVSLNGELQEPAAEVPEQPAETPTEEVPADNGGENQEVQTPDQPYDVGIVNEKWYLFDYDNGKQYAISDFITAKDNYKAKLEESEKKLNGKNILVVVLILVIVALVGVLAFFVYKLFFNQDADFAPRREERNPVRQGEGQRKTAQGSSQARNPRQGQRPPAKQGGISQSHPSQGNKEHDIRVRSVSTPTGGKTVSAPEANQSVQEKAPGNEQKANVKQEHQPKNFIQDDDEFTFEFLNWNGEEDE